MILPALGAVLFLLAPQNNNAADARDLLARGTQLLASKPAEAVKLLQQAVRIDPDLPDLRYQLGLAFHAIGDEADAEAELREAAGRKPESPAVHNYLGIVLFQLGNAKAALEEFRVAAQLSPKDPNAHFNLGEALARTGDSIGALDELRVAAELAPEDAGLTRLVKVVENAIATPNSTIRVDVRQVLVPVVVTDKDGHHIDGLTQDDFRIFEDGAEQKITAFSVESSVAAQSGEGIKTAPAQGASAPPRVAPPHSAIRHTYLIVIDTLHSSFNNFVAEREALVKFFKQEQSADSQYVVVSLGVSAEMVANTTSDVNAVLSVFESKRFQKIFQDGQLGGIKGDLERFRHDLNETRMTCDAMGNPPDHMLEPKCQAGIDRSPLEAQAIAEIERNQTITFLRQFRSLVAQLAQARDRRTIVLLSEGFQIAPGHDAYELLNAYFPFNAHCLVPEGVSCPFNIKQTALRMESEFEPILQLAAKSNVTIDTIDARGLFGQSSFDASSAGSAVTVTSNIDRVDRNIASANGNTLAEIADATGGTAFHDSNNLFGGLQKAFADSRDYYTLAYVSTNTNLDGKFRAITVQVRGRKVVVNAKKGYWAAPGAQ